ncbi:50S small subunit ribosomal protein L2 [Cryptococcus deuterogattii R265]|uniref:Large ribosomal subunit protein uL2m n=1 Tax=Cryptococcus deuterogattii (strain R265) TaxID=294750 RepID=A0A095CEU0_CRYD2|nr:50S small subunit ribosomal protein L2 [Cryptococcus deuterogattii R265]KIR73808.1 50S small subunit ribosomal protein L2 [Cryptococcus deuterogattii CA1014]
MPSLHRPALSAARAVAQRNVAAARIPSTVAAARLYSTDTQNADEKQQMMFGGPPPTKKDEGAILKRYTGPGFPFIPSLRHVVYPYHPHLHKGGPVKELTIPLRRKGGRSSLTGQIVTRHRGGGHKRRIRVVDFHRRASGEHDVIRIEYDPGRSAHIALIKKRGSTSTLSAEQAEESLAEGGYGNEAVKGGWSYIIAPLGLRAGDVVVSYRSGIPEKLIQECDMTSSMYGGSTLSNNETDVISPPPRKSLATDTPEMRRALGMLRTITLKPGNVLPLYLIPPGMQVHNISLTVDGRMQLCRSAGTFGQIVSHQGSDGRSIGGSDVLTMGGGFDEQGNRVPKMGFVLVKLQSGEVRKLDPGCVATIGVVSNKEHQFRQLGKAGRNRWLGRRPHVRGAAMNAVDHAHGGGRGKSKGNKHPRSIYGTLQHVRTRRPKDKDGNKAVVTERPRGKQTAAKH